MQNRLYTLHEQNAFSYIGRRLYQYNEDDFLFEFKLLTRFFRVY